MVEKRAGLGQRLVRAEHHHTGAVRTRRTEEQLAG
jgi:hypothetical protein